MNDRGNAADYFEASRLARKSTIYAFERLWAAERALWVNMKYGAPRWLKRFIAWAIRADVTWGNP